MNKNVLTGLILLLPSIMGSFEKLETPLTVSANQFGGDLFELSSSWSDLEYYLDGKKLTHLKEKNLWLGVLPLGQRRWVPVYGISPVYHTSEGPKIRWSEHFVEVSPPLSETVQLRFPSSVWNKVTNQEDERQRNREQVLAMYKREDGQPNFDCPKPPMNSGSVSKFGSPRQLPNGDFYHHTGEDLRAKVGTPVFASAPGEVEFAGEMVLPGKLVMLYHGGGFHSRYFHLSDIDVKENDRVEIGQKIALSGATGRVTAPHLHWEIVWKGNPANPPRFLNSWRKICSINRD